MEWFDMIFKFAMSFVIGFAIGYLWRGADSDERKEKK